MFSCVICRSSEGEIVACWIRKLRVTVYTHKSCLCELRRKMEKLTPFMVGNQFGYLCPECKSGENLYITALVTVALVPDGCDTGDSHTEWDKESHAWCGCGWKGKVKDFAQAENFEEE